MARSTTPITNFRLPVELREQVRELALEQSMTLTDAVIEALELWVRRQQRRQRR